MMNWNDFVEYWKIGREGISKLSRVNHLEEEGIPSEKQYEDFSS